MVLGLQLTHLCLFHCFSLVANRNPLKNGSLGSVVQSIVCLTTSLNVNSLSTCRLGPTLSNMLLFLLKKCEIIIYLEKLSIQFALLKTLSIFDTDQ